MEEVVMYMNKIDVLPCINGSPGFVRLVDYMGSDLSIVRSARVSYNADWRSTIDESQTLPKDEKLIEYLWRNQHTSPFESVTFTFEVKAPIFVFRQHHRHRTWSYNEVSARYTELDEGFYVPEESQITTQSTSNKQMRTQEQHPESEWIRSIIHEECERTTHKYHMLIQKGCPRELARGLLPVNTYSRMFATVNLLNLAKFLKLRLHEHAQYEIRVYAMAMLKLIEPILPVATRVIKESME